MSAYALVKQIMLCFNCFSIVICLLMIINQQNVYSNTCIIDSTLTETEHVRQIEGMRFLLYDVNPGEGFNLRRDVYIRISNLVLELNKKEPWTLVLPPWGSLHHWTSKVEQSRVPWATFFDLHSLSLHVPVLEFKDFLKVLGDDRRIEDVYYLPRYYIGRQPTQKTSEPTIEVTKCSSAPSDEGFKQDSQGRWHWSYWGYDGIYSTSLTCLSAQVQSTHMAPFLTNNTRSRSVFLVRAEQLSHGDLSTLNPSYWRARRSLVFAKHLRDIGDEFREESLNSTDEKDGTVVSTDWIHTRKKHGEAVGGPYLAVHLRRGDFLNGGRENVPTMLEAASQIQALLKKIGLQTVYISTDANEKDYSDLEYYMHDYNIQRYKPTDDILEKYKDGGLAIIDQWISAHARYFIGTSGSTFSIRIQEEREILGFDPATTFNSMCGYGLTYCGQPVKQEIVYPQQPVL